MSVDPPRPTVFIEPGTIDDVDELDRLVGLLADSLGERDGYRSTPRTFRRYGFGERRLFSTLLAWPSVSGFDAGARSRKSANLEGVSETKPRSACGACVYLPDYSTWRARPGVYILDLIVEPDWRRFGVGLELLHQATRRGYDEWDADYVILAVDHANTGAIRFYQRNGFTLSEKTGVMLAPISW